VPLTVAPVRIADAVAALEASADVGTDLLALLGA
jgi:hypothetical protein